jgi:hypothetical protein
MVVYTRFDIDESLLGSSFVHVQWMFHAWIVIRGCPAVAASCQWTFLSERPAGAVSVGYVLFISAMSWSVVLDPAPVVCELRAGSMYWSTSVTSP